MLMNGRMKKRADKISLSFLLAVTAVHFAFLFIFAIIPYLPKIAFADSSVEFLISTADGTHWQLSLEGETMDEFTGEFINPTTTNVASVKFYESIQDILAEREESDYNLSFALPEIACEAVGESEVVYTKQEGAGLWIKPNYSPMFDESATVIVQYKKADSGKFETYEFYVERDGGFTFGTSVGVGDYLVRLVVIERLNYDGKTYTVPRYAQAVECSVVSADIEAPSVAEIRVEYGTRLGNVQNAIYSEDGVWTLSAEQDDGLTANSLLEVKEGGYKIKFDYTSNNKNYNPVLGVPLDVTVYARTLRVYLDNASSFMGEPLVTDFNYTVATPLLDGDTIEDLGIEIYVHEFDNQVAGRYFILARFANANYIPDCRNMHNTLAYGGTYIVYAAKLTATAEDGNGFIAYFENGVEDLSFRVTSEALLQDAEGGYVQLARYRLIFENQYGERVFYNGDFVLTFVDNSRLGATHICLVTADGQAHAKSKITERISAGANVDIIEFYAFYTKGLSGIEIANIVLASVCCALAVVFVALIVVCKLRRRTFR